MTRDEIIAALRYQIVTPRVTTMGWCANGCGRVARGAGKCPACWTLALSLHVGISEAMRVADELRTEAEANWAREDEA